MMPGYGKVLAPSAAAQETDKKADRKTSKKIGKAHPQFELAYDMMLGIRTCIGIMEKTPVKAVLDAADYIEERRYRFPKVGSHTTPAHATRDFKFKDYAPEVFRKIRHLAKIAPQDYLMCLCGNFTFIEFLSNSKSGAFFFYSYDRQYMIKTITQAEKDFLVRVLPNYALHLENNPNSLINKFYGLHRVKPHKREQVHFLIMGSIFFTRRIMHLTFDLKGSSHGREASAKARLKGDCVYKDNDFVNMKVTIEVGPARAQMLNEQIAKDAHFLQSLNIMDYSLLLGIHDTTHKMLKREDSVSLMFTQKDASPQVDPSMKRTMTPAAPDEYELHPPGREEKELSELRGGDPVLDARPSTCGGVPTRRQTVHALPRKYSSYASPAELKFQADPMAVPLPAAAPEEEKPPIDRQPSDLFGDDGGMKGQNSEGEFNNKIYYLGIIDILIEYGVAKKAESRLKSIKYQLSSISACPPSMYSKRFKDFLTARIQ